MLFFVGRHIQVSWEIRTPIYQHAWYSTVSLGGQRRWNAYPTDRLFR